VEGKVGAAAGLRRREAKGLAALHRVCAVGREGLAAWAGAAAVVADPIDPIILQETVADVLRGAK